VFWATDAAEPARTSSQQMAIFARNILSESAGLGFKTKAMRSLVLNNYDCQEIFPASRTFLENVYLVSRFL
jgi:hypothetical protein